MNHEEKILHRLRESGGLSPGVRLTLIVAELLWKQSGSDWAIITHAGIAAFTGASKDTVKEHLEHGARLGWFERKESRGHGWMYSFGEAEPPAVEPPPSPLTPLAEGEGGGKTPPVVTTPPRVEDLAPGTPTHVHATPTPPTPPTGGSVSSSGESELQRTSTASPDEEPPQRLDFSDPIALINEDIPSLCRSILKYQAWARTVAAPSRRAEGMEPQPAAWSEADVKALHRFVSAAMFSGHEYHRVLAWAQTQLDYTADRTKPIMLGRAIAYLKTNLANRREGTYDELSANYEPIAAPERPAKPIRRTEDYTEEERRQIAAENDRGIDYMAQIRAKLGGAK